MNNISRPNDDHHRAHRHGWLQVGWVTTSLLVLFAYQHCVHPQLRLWPGVVAHGNPAHANVALTFDDGPYPLVTPLLDDTLTHYGAHGTFFLVGEDAQRYPELVARLVRHGHQPGNHSLTHPQSPNLESLPAPRVRREILESAKILTQITGRPVPFFRPPGGGLSDAVLEILRQHHMLLAWWSCSTADYYPQPPAEIVGRLRAALRPGLIVLMHQRPWTIAALEQFFSRGRAGDYAYATLTETVHGE